MFWTSCRKQLKPLSFDFANSQSDDCILTNKIRKSAHSIASQRYPLGGNSDKDFSLGK